MKSAKKNGVAAAAVLGEVMVAGSAVVPALADDGRHGYGGVILNDQDPGHAVILNARTGTSWFCRFGPEVPASMVPV